MKVQTISVSDLNPAPYNPRIDLRPGDPEYDALKRSIETFGLVEPIVWNERTGHVVGGHQRLKVLIENGATDADCVVVDLDEANEKALNIALNKIGGDWNDELLTEILAEMRDANFDLALTGFNEEEIAALFDEIAENERDRVDLPDTSLFETFLVPPFSVLDTRQGYWQERKREWLERGIRSEVGRDDDLIFGDSLGDWAKENRTSVFDPVLCEVLYHWFNVSGGRIFDPFAGGSVRGIVANAQGFPYVGIDLRAEQVESNYRNADEMGVDLNAPGLCWIPDDSLNMDAHVEDASCDMVFTCPPYFDLEVYSELENDISNMSFEAFCDVYSRIIKKAAAKLKDNRFAVVVISDIRDKQGFYRDLTGWTKQCFSEMGMFLYNDIILLNAGGTAALRARRNMYNRKVVRIHQNVLVFYKGKPKDIQSVFPALTELEDEEALENLA